MWDLFFIVCSVTFGSFQCDDKAKANAETIKLEMYEAESERQCMNQSISVLSSWARMQQSEYQFIRWYCVKQNKDEQVNAKK